MSSSLLSSTPVYFTSRNYNPRYNGKIFLSLFCVLEELAWWLSDWRPQHKARRFRSTFHLWLLYGRTKVWLNSIPGVADTRIDCCHQNNGWRLHTITKHETLSPSFFFFPLTLALAWEGSILICISQVIVKGAKLWNLGQPVLQVSTNSNGWS